MKITIPVLPLWQPWAAAMASRDKMNETRHWPTKFRGLVAILAAKKWDAETRAVYESPCCFRLREAYGAKPPLGGIVALTIITDCKPTESFHRQPGFEDSLECKLGNYAPGRFAFVTEGTQQIKPLIPLLGRQQPFFPWEVHPGELILAAHTECLTSREWFACLMCGNTSRFGAALDHDGCPRCGHRINRREPQSMW